MLSATDYSLSVLTNIPVTANFKMNLLGYAERVPALMNGFKLRTTGLTP